MVDGRAGHDLKQETHQKFFDVAQASCRRAHRLPTCGADLWRLDLKSAGEQIIPITLFPISISCAITGQAAATY